MSDTLLTSKKIRSRYDLTKEEYNRLVTECLDSPWNNAVVRVGKAVCVAEPIWKAFLLAKSYTRKLKLAGDHPEKSYVVAYYPRTHANGKDFLDAFFEDIKDLALADWQTAKEARTTYGISKEDFKSLKDECLSSREWTGTIVLVGSKTYVVKPIFARFLMAKSFKDRQNQSQSHAPNSKIYGMDDLSKLSEKELVRLMIGLDAEQKQTEKVASDPRYEQLRDDIDEIKKSFIELKAEMPKKTKRTRKRVAKTKTRKATAKAKTISKEKTLATAASEVKANAGDAQVVEPLATYSSSTAAETMSEANKSTESSNFSK